MESEDGWKKTDITVTSADERRLGTRVLTLPFYHRDMGMFLKEEYGSSAYRGHFALEFAKLEVNGER